MTRAVLILFVCLLAASSCSKGYRVRFSNFYTESMDTVKIGYPGAVFAKIERNTVTDYKDITSGDHYVLCKTVSGAQLHTTAPLAKGGEGDFTVQLDAIGNFSLLKD